jgi:hypothetical protein
MRWALAIVVAGCQFSSGVVPRDGAVDVPPDMPIDVPGFDPSVCPVDYLTIIPSVPTSRYRLLLTSAKYSAQHANGVDDEMGLTHLVVFNSHAEAKEVGAAYGMAAGIGPNSVFYIGAVQPPNQASPSSSWLWLTGGPVVETWANGAPNDGDNVENNRENAARSVWSGLLEDAFPTLLGNAVCECDGVAVEPTIATYVPP